MSARALAAPHPHGCFIAGSRGPLFCMHYPSRSGEGARYVLCVPPLAEEMNKARRMWTLLAQRVQSAGMGAVVPDLFGTGDSAGDFAAARWSIWRDDLDAVHAFARSQGATQISICALRLGAPLALDWLRASRPEHIDQIILWQPTVNGAVALTQFLRLRLAANLRRPGAGDSMQAMRERLVRGEALEIAGYEISAELAQSIDALRLEGLAPPPTVPVRWLEITADAARGTAPVSAAVIREWRELGCAVSDETVTGEPFWSTPEISVTPALLEATARQLRANG